MSLLDDVSIVVTPNGYKAGTLYGVLPTYAEGSELVTDGDFALTGTQAASTTGTYWTTGQGWTISNNVATVTNIADHQLKQTLSFLNGFTYKISFEITEITQGSLKVYLRDGGNQGFVGGTYNTTGVKEFVVKATTTSDTFTIYPSGTTTASVTNISVKEVTSSDMDVTRETAATRVDEDGLVNYAEIIGSELVPSIITTEDNNGGVINYISGNIYSSTSDGTSTSTIRPKFNFNTTSGKTYKLVITPTGTITGTVNFDFHNGSSYLFSNYDFTTTKEIYFTDNGNVFGAFDGTQIYNITGFTISVKEVTRDNVPRIDYTGGGCPHILAEPQRTNLIEYSEELTSTTNVTPSNTISPDGTLNALKINETISNSQHYGTSYAASVVDDGTIYTISFYIKKGTNDLVKVYTQSSRISASIWITFSTESTSVNGSDVVSSSNFMEDAGNGWYRVGFSATANSTGSVSIYLPVKDLTTYVGDVSQYTEYWGAQCEVGSYATSYIPTSGSTVTRNKDIFTRDGIGSLINSTEGVLFVEMANFNGNTVAPVISLNNGTSSQTVALYYFSTDEIAFDILSSSPNVSGISSSYNTDNFNKIALKYKSGDIALWVNGVEVLTKTNTISLTGLNKISFDYGNGTYSFYGKVKQLQVYDTALTDEQLLQLTGESGTDFYESYAEMAAALTYTIQ